MPCRCKLEGLIELSRNAYLKLAEHLTTQETDNRWERYNYDDEFGSLHVYRELECDQRDDSTCAAVEQIVTLLARYKDHDDLSELNWEEEETGDWFCYESGRYYIGCGRWCYVPDTMPSPPPPDSPEWYWVKHYPGRM